MHTLSLHDALPISLQDGTVVDTDYIAASSALSMAVLEWMRDGIAAELSREAETLDSEDTGAEEAYRRNLQSSMLQVTPAQGRERGEFVQAVGLSGFVCT